MNVKLHSRILQYFDIDTLIEINYIMKADITNSERGAKIIALLSEHVRKKGGKLLLLGSGTNRIGLQIEDCVFKIALDIHGCIDNRREFKYTDKLQPYVIKVYECLPDGLVAACEVFNSFTKDDWELPEVKDSVMEVLQEVSKNFFIGDIGYSSKNYANWGFRKTDKRVGILDFAYIYTTSYHIFSCVNPNCRTRAFLQYDSNYVDLVCPACGKKYTFADIRKRISRKQQEEEIGDIRKLSYIMTDVDQVFEANPNYTISLYSSNIITDEKKSEKERLKKENRKMIEKLDRPKDSFNEFDLDEPTTFEEIMERISEGSL